MPLWKITVKRMVNRSRVRLEEGMSVELVNSSVVNPLTHTSNHAQIRQLFMNKYGVDPENYVSPGYMDVERIS